jgi:hypothetical protein
MKIISKYKDYYDFVVHDPDSHIIYERKNQRVVDQEVFDIIKSEKATAVTNAHIGYPASIIKKIIWPETRNSYWHYGSYSFGGPSAEQGI